MSSQGVIGSLHQFAEVAFLAIAALFAIVNPLGGAPIFLAKTADLSTSERATVARLVATYGFLLLAGATLIGSHVLDFFDVSIPVVQVAGGLVVCSIGWALLNQPNSPIAKSGDAAVAKEDPRERAFYPLTMPLTVGPGSISVAITLAANAGEKRRLFFTILAHLTGMLIVAMSVYLCYRYADRILKRLGPTGTIVLVRLSAFILLCIGVQICWNGVHALVAPLVIRPAS
ncbi:MAG TPA: MarC family protein [Thermoanaerobaculia bacterium]|jgi:multiple antibiotic resistance protein|nr:MarC family protein [Thermoanaerobaculia bacterium]